MVDNNAFLARIRRPMHDLVRHEILNRYTYRFDLLHMCDHHGVTSHVIANVLWSHVSSDREGGSIPGDAVDERLDFVQDDIAGFYRARRVANRLPTTES